MELQLAPDETDLLRRVLQSYLADLREEIGKTEKYELRQSLKDDEARIKAILECLGG